MQQYKIKISLLAEEDLENIGDYIAYVLLNPIAARNTVKGIRRQINRLKRFPKSHEFDEDVVLANLGIHKTYYKDYKIFYMVENNLNTVYVVRILHMRVDSKSWLYRTFDID